jgi:hypothetical protein
VKSGGLRRTLLAKIRGRKPAICTTGNPRIHFDLRTNCPWFQVWGIGFARSPYFNIGKIVCDLRLKDL